MKRTKLKDRVLPDYTNGEEIFNMTSHIVGAVLGLIVIIASSIIGALRGNVYGIVSGIVFGLSMLVLYLMSSIYHGLKPDLTAKKVFQVLDHCAIFILIAGSYTPFALCVLRKYSTILGWSIFGIIWVFAILGIVLNSIDLKKYEVFSMICYIVMGWCIIMKINILPALLTTKGFVLLLIGGVIYTIGAVLYGIGSKYRYMHSMFHLCVLVGNILHAICILMYVI